MKAVLLCAGYATRLYPLTKDRPKPLLAVADKAILEYIVDELSTLDDIDSIYIVTNDKFASHFESWKQAYSSPKTIEIVNDNTASDETKLGAIGDIHFTLKAKETDDDVIVIAGDNIFDLRIRDFIDFAREHKETATIAAYDVKDKDLAKKYGLVKIDDSAKIIDFQEKPQKPETTLASLGLYYYPRDMVKLIFQYVEEGNNADQPGNFVSWLSRKKDVFTYVFDGVWFDIGDFKSLEKADLYFKGQNKEDNK